MSDEIGQNLTNKPSDDLRATARKNTREDKARSESQSVLNLAALNGVKKPLSKLLWKKSTPINPSLPNNLPNRI